MKYETTSSHLNRLIRAERVLGMNFETHMHYSFEFFYVVSGENFCTVEDTEYRLTAGQAVLVFPNQKHSYHTPVASECVMLIFDPIYVNEYYKFVRGREFECPVFSVEPDTVGRLPDTRDVFEWKSLLYHLCSLATRQCILKKATKKNNQLIEQVVEYVYEHLDEKITLEQVAKNLGYSYHYLSNQIQTHFGMNFCGLVNHYRIDRAATLLRTTDLSMTEVAAKSGFSTIRSFNRTFKQIHRVTPSQFAKEK